MPLTEGIGAKLNVTKVLKYEALGCYTTGC